MCAFIPCIHLYIYKSNIGIHIILFLSPFQWFIELTKGDLKRKKIGYTVQICAATWKVCSGRPKYTLFKFPRKWSIDNVRWNSGPYKPRRKGKHDQGQHMTWNLSRPRWPRFRSEVASRREPLGTSHVFPLLSLAWRGLLPPINPGSDVAHSALRV